MKKKMMSRDFTIKKTNEFAILIIPIIKITYYDNK